MDKSAWERFCENKRIERRIIRNIFFFQIFFLIPKKGLYEFLFPAFHRH